MTVLRDERRYPDRPYAKFKLHSVHHVERPGRVPLAIYCRVEFRGEYVVGKAVDVQPARPLADGESLWLDGPAIDEAEAGAVRQYAAECEMGRLRSA